MQLAHADIDEVCHAHNTHGRSSGLNRTARRR
jgi:hypothetical protein